MTPEIRQTWKNNLYSFGHYDSVVKETKTKQIAYELLSLVSARLSLRDLGGVLGLSCKIRRKLLHPTFSDPREQFTNMDIVTNGSKSVRTISCNQTKNPWTYLSSTSGLLCLSTSWQGKFCKQKKNQQLIKQISI